MRRPLAWFLAISGVHFLVSVVGTIVSLRAAFDTQASFWAAPGAAVLADVSAILLAPLEHMRPVLPAAWRGSYAEIAAVSALFGGVTVGLLHLSRLFRAIRAE